MRKSVFDGSYLCMGSETPVNNCLAACNDSFDVSVPRCSVSVHYDTTDIQYQTAQYLLQVHMYLAHFYRFFNISQFLWPINILVTAENLLLSRMLS